MQKHLMVPVYALKRAIEASTGSTKSLLETCLAHCTPVPTDVIPSVTKLEVVEALDLKCSYDFALPQSWYDEFSDTMGMNPLQYFVWDCDTDQPVPVSETARLLLAVFHHVYSSK